MHHEIGSGREFFDPAHRRMLAVLHLQLMLRSAGLIRATLASGVGEDVSEGPSYEPNEKSSSETYPPVSALYACEENHGCESATGPIQNTPQALKDFLHPLPRFVTQPVTQARKSAPPLMPSGTDLLGDHRRLPG